MEGCKLGEGIVADDVRVQDEEWCVVLAEDVLCKLKRTGGAQGLGFDREGDLNAELLLVL